MLKTDRRLLLASLCASLLPLEAISAFGASPGPRLGPAQPFSFAGLVEIAKKNAGQPYKAPAPRAAEIIHNIDFDAVQIRLATLPVILIAGETDRDALLPLAKHEWSSADRAPGRVRSAEDVDDPLG